MIFRKNRPANAKFRAAILDFDGTLTDIEKESEGFHERYMKELAKTVGLSDGLMAAIWEGTSRRIKDSPEAFGWKIDGKIIAPAMADPYVFATVIAGEALDTLSLLRDQKERAMRLSRIFEDSYGPGKIVFRDGAKDFLEEIMSTTHASIVTSSPKERVDKKLSTLNLKIHPQVFGDARKFVLDHSWESVPESVDAGLGRPVYLRRKNYWGIIEDFLSKRTIDTHDAFVMGDIYELDLSLPSFFGMKAFLISKSTTQAEEIQAVRSSSGSHLSSLHDLIRFQKDAA